MKYFRVRAVAFQLKIHIDESETTASAVSPNGMAMTRKPPTRDRNREMLMAYEAGIGMICLAARYNLKVISVRNLLSAEQHRRAVSLDPYYRILRGEAI